MADKLPVPPLWTQTQVGRDLTPATYPPGGTLVFPAGAGGGGGLVTSVGGTAPIASSGGTAPVISLNNSAVTPGTYGDSGNVGQFTVDAHGLLTFAQNVPIAGGSSAANLWQYRAKTSATSGYPGDGYILWNNATQTGATSLLLAHLTNDDLDIDVFLATVATGNTLLLQDANNSDNNQKWTVSSAPTQTNGGTATSYWTIPVTLVSSAGTGTTGFPNNHQLVVFRFVNAVLTNTHIYVGNASNAPADVALSGDATLANTGAMTLATVNSNVGTFGDATHVGQFTVNAKGLITAASNVFMFGLTSSHIYVGNGSNVATDVALSGDATLANTGAMTLATVNSNVGTFTNATITVNAKGLITAASTGSGGGGTITTKQDGTTVSSTVTTLDIQGPVVTTGASATAKLFVVSPDLATLGCAMI